MNKENWMGNTPDLGRLRIDELILPGSHDSGMDAQINGVIAQEITQDVPCIEQVRGGIRVLDLRLRAYHEYTPEQPYRYQLYHLTSSGRTLFGDVLNPLREFFKDPANAREIVVLDFHQFDRFGTKEHQWLREAANKHFGSMFIPWSLHDLTLETLWREHPGKNIVVAYNNRDRGDYWPGVRQIWIGENTPSADTLKAFMDSQPPADNAPGQLNAIQCAKYNVVELGRPDDFSDKIDEWFDSQDLNSYIQRFRIINTDWSLRSRIVDNCIHACQLRAQNTP
ncbi:hypothetical protein ACIPZ8_12925 [Pseudomonas sp. NPDC089422]|uniref:hypothetical protein n=1 Tax=Pseudomonas sp. NPDC089422 TaxID=3364466 RepID=UPI00380AC65F